jgi:hypothetical protein
MVISCPLRLRARDSLSTDFEAPPTIVSALVGANCAPTNAILILLGPQVLAYVTQFSDCNSLNAVICWAATASACTQPRNKSSNQRGCSCLTYRRSICLSLSIEKGQTLYLLTSRNGRLFCSPDSRLMSLVFCHD